MNPTSNLQRILGPWSPVPYTGQTYVENQTQNLKKKKVKQRQPKHFFNLSSQGIWIFDNFVLITPGIQFNWKTESDKRCLQLSQAWELIELDWKTSILDNFWCVHVWCEPPPLGRSLSVQCLADVHQPTVVLHWYIVLALDRSVSWTGQNQLKCFQAFCSVIIISKFFMYSRICPHFNLRGRKPTKHIDKDTWLEQELFISSFGFGIKVKKQVRVC